MIKFTQGTTGSLSGVSAQTRAELSGLAWEFDSFDAFLIHLQPFLDACKPPAHWVLNPVNRNMLMLVADGGFYWRTVGWIEEGLSLVDLPYWDKGRYRVREDDDPEFSGFQRVEAEQDAFEPLDPGPACIQCRGVLPEGELFTCSTNCALLFAGPF